jgi:hypothetical protein
MYHIALKNGLQRGLSIGFGVDAHSFIPKGRTNTLFRSRVVTGI